MRLFSQVAIALVTASIVSCANPYKVKELEDSKLEKKGEIQGATIGINEDKEVVIQKETAADSELRKLAATAYDLEVKLTNEQEELARCREELSDPRLGGAGKVVEIPELDLLKPTSQVKEEFGITKEGNLSFVKKEKFLDRLKDQRKYNDILGEQLKLTEKHRKTCSREMRTARVNNGLPAERYKGKGEYVNGKYILVRQPERSLDDAFSIRSEEAGKAKEKTSQASKEAPSEN